MGIEKDKEDEDYEYVLINKNNDEEIKQSESV